MYNKITQLYVKNMPANAGDTRRGFNPATQLSVHTYTHSHTYIYIIFIIQSLFLCRLLQDIEYSSLSYKVGPCWLSILHLVESEKVKSLSHVQLFATPQSVAYHAPPSMGFSRQGYWSGVPLPAPEDLPDPRIKPGSPTL